MDYISTLIIDHETIFRECLAATLSDQRDDLLIVDTYQGGNDVLDVDLEEEIDLLIMDLNLLDIDGLDLIPLLRRRSKSIKIVVLTRYSKTKLVKESLKKGADGYLLKTDSLKELYQAIDDVLAGNTYLGKGLHITPPANGIVSVMKEDANGTIYEDRYTIKEKLTKREQEILSLIAQAKNNKQIAAELYISDQTVGVHRKNMMRKLGVHSTVNLVKLAIEFQLVD
jgi:DNA-binding NarL/FixJ family response regulator